jgi:hypothetical protein
MTLEERIVDLGEHDLVLSLAVELHPAVGNFHTVHGREPYPWMICMTLAASGTLSVCGRDMNEAVTRASHALTQVASF